MYANLLHPLLYDMKARVYEVRLRLCDRDWSLLRRVRQSNYVVRLATNLIRRSDYIVRLLHEIDIILESLP